ncbi:TPA: hypothetical protein JBJ46_15065 [Legionella pneumophila]|nr:hypothetical protein [Legionella pneumophila]
MRLSQSRYPDSFVASLPSNLTHLDLSWNNLGNQPGEKLIKAFKALQLELTCLNLSTNNLHKLSGYDLSQIFANLPKVGALDLSGNCLFSKSIAELMGALRGLPPSVHSLCLGDNHLFF